MSRDGDNFADRWVRRKRAVAEEEARESAPESPEPEAEEDQPEAELLEKLGLPDPDTLEQGDDFAAFMKQGVPMFLRKRALKKLWLSNPTLANLDGLLDYGEDYTDAAMVPEVLNTVYQVGKGMLREAAKSDPEDDEVLESAPGKPATEPEQDPEPTELAEASERYIKPEPEHTDIEDEVLAHTPQRMRFVYD